MVHSGDFSRGVGLFPWLAGEPVVEVHLLAVVDDAEGGAGGSLLRVSPEAALGDVGGVIEVDAEADRLAPGPGGVIGMDNVNDAARGEIDEEPPWNWHR